MSNQLPAICLVVVLCPSGGPLDLPCDGCEKPQLPRLDSDCHAHPGTTTTAPIEWSKIAADSREWSKRGNPNYVQAEHWGP